MRLASLLAAALSAVTCASAFAQGQEAGDTPDSLATSLDSVMSRLRMRTTERISADARTMDTAFRDSVSAAYDSTVITDGLAETLRRHEGTGRVRGGSVGVRTGIAWSPEDLNLDYTKVDGFTASTATYAYASALGVRSRLGGRLGYAVGSARSRHDAGVELSAHDITLGWAHREVTASFGWTEVHGRRLYALAGDDELDYLEREGWRAYLTSEYLLPADLTARVTYRDETERPRHTRDYFTIGGRSDLFDANAQATRGTVHAMGLAVRRSRLTYPNLYGSLDAETAGRGLGGDLAYDRIRARVTRIRRLPWADELSIALSAQATAGPDGAIPLQALADPSGRSGVRGYPHRSLVGTHALLARIEYRVARDLFARTRLPILSTAKLQLVPFVDVGAAWTPALTRELSDATWPDAGDWKWGAGLGVRRAVGFGELLSHVRMDAALRLDRGNARPVFYLVLEGEPFN